MNYSFVSGNKVKYEELERLFAKHGIKLDWINESKPEPADELDIKKVSVFAAKELAEKHKMPVIVEDTGFFFDHHFDPSEREIFEIVAS